MSFLTISGAGGSARGIFAGTDDDPNIVGDYTRDTADAGLVSGGIFGEYTVLGDTASKGALKLANAVRSEETEDLVRIQRDASMIAALAKQFGVATGAVKKALLKELARRKKTATGPQPVTDGSAALPSAAKLLGGALVLAGIGWAASKALKKKAA